jgi:hypothetical protein
MWLVFCKETKVNLTGKKQEILAMDRGRLKWFTEGEYTGRLGMSTKKEEKVVIKRKITFNERTSDFPSFVFCEWFAMSSDVEIRDY